MQMYCTFVLFVNQHFLWLPASGTHCMCLLETVKAFNPILIFHKETLLSFEKRLVFSKRICGELRYMALALVATKTFVRFALKEDIKEIVE
jgi:hypothetical protein